MIVDYRIYCTIYAVLFAVYLVGFPALFGSRHYSRGVWTWATVLGVTGLTNFLDWLWS